MLFKLTYSRKCQAWIRLSRKADRHFNKGVWNKLNDINVNESKSIKNITTVLKFQNNTISDYHKYFIIFFTKKNLLQTCFSITVRSFN